MTLLNYENHRHTHPRLTHPRKCGRARVGGKADRAAREWMRHRPGSGDCRTAQRMTNEQIETELKHVATKEDLQRETASLHREMAIQTRWLIGIMVTLQLPTWIGIFQIWSFLATIASKLPK
jgi:hypothetical protein